MCGVKPIESTAPHRTPSTAHARARRCRTVRIPRPQCSNKSRQPPPIDSARHVLTCAGRRTWLEPRALVSLYTCIFCDRAPRAPAPPPARRTGLRIHLQTHTTRYRSRCERSLSLSVSGSLAACGLRRSPTSHTQSLSRRPNTATGRGGCCLLLVIFFLMNITKPLPPK